MDIERDKIDEWVTKRDQEKYFFALKDMTEVQSTFDEMIGIIVFIPHILCCIFLVILTANVIQTHYILFNAMSMLMCFSFKTHHFCAIYAHHLYYYRVF